jgi:hypothetical protein
MSGNPEGIGLRRGLSYLLSVLCCALLLQGCTVVRIENADGSTTVRHRVGLAAIHPGDANALIRITSFGLHTALGTSTLGFGHTEVVTIAPGSCEVILWGASPETAKHFRDLLGEDASVCAPTAAAQKPTQSTKVSP